MELIRYPDETADAPDDAEKIFRHVAELQKGGRCGEFMTKK